MKMNRELTAIRLCYRLVGAMLLLLPLQVSGQALRGTTGLLHAPTAEMQKDKTLMIGGNVLHLTPLHYFSSDEVDYTFNYYLNITFFPWLEVGYTCTINYANHGSGYFPQHVWGRYTNQDRSFYARIRLWKEGWWKAWTPQVVLGLDDPTSHESYGGGAIRFDEEGMQNNHFTRYYLAATKHFDWKDVGRIGAHLSFVLDRGDAGHRNRPAAGVNFAFRTPEVSFWNKALNGLNLMAEYDARTCNVGGTYSIWKERINLVAELNDGKYFSGGVYFKICLK